MKNMSQWILAGSVLSVAFACQGQTKPSNKPPEQNQQQDQQQQEEQQEEYQSGCRCTGQSSDAQPSLAQDVQPIAEGQSVQPLPPVPVAVSAPTPDAEVKSEVLVEIATSPNSEENVAENHSASIESH